MEGAGVGFSSGYLWQLILRAGMYVFGGIVGHSGLLDHKRVPTVLPKHIPGGGLGIHSQCRLCSQECGQKHGPHPESPALQ